MENYLFVHETFINETEGYQIGKSEWYESRATTVKELFKELQKEYGKGTKMFVDTENGGARQIGWVFQKQVKYTDCNKKYTRQVWVEVSKTLPVKKCVLTNVEYPFS